MKTCLKILLATNFLLQISMANKITEYEEDEGSTDREQDHETESNQPSDNKALEYEEDEGKAETVQDHETEESDQTSDNKTPGYEEDEGSPEKVEDHETEGSNQNSDNKTPGYEEDEGSPEKVEDPETEGSNQNSDNDTPGYEEDEGSPETEEDHKTEESDQTSDNKTPGYEEDEGSPETIEDHETEESDQTSDNVIHPSDIVPCDSLSTHNKEVQEEIVNIHNQYRRDVIPSAGNMLKMTWSDKLMKSAWNWANTCNLNHSEVKDRNDDGAPYGENILSSPVCVKWEKTIKQWYNERENLIWGVGPKGNSVVGHYTQIVTDHTYQIGCAMKKCNVKEKIIIFSVCQYYPAGNRPSSLYRPYEKGEPCSHCPKACDESGKFCLNSCKHVDDARNCELAKSVGQCDQYLEVCKATCLCENKIT